MSTNDAMPPEVEEVDYLVACRTKGCVNEGIQIAISARAEKPRIVCGPCGVVIADIQRV